MARKSAPKARRTAARSASTQIADVDHADELAVALGRAAAHAATHSKPSKTAPAKEKDKPAKAAKPKASPGAPFPMKVVLRPVASESLPPGMRFDQLPVGKTFVYREAYVRGWPDLWVKDSDTHYRDAAGGTPYRAPLDSLVLEQPDAAKAA